MKISEILAMATIGALELESATEDLELTNALLADLEIEKAEVAAKVRQTGESAGNLAFDTLLTLVGQGDPEDLKRRSLALKARSMRLGLRQTQLQEESTVLRVNRVNQTIATTLLRIGVKELVDLAGEEL